SKRCTATPTNFSDKTEHATNRTWMFPAQNGHGRTPANNACRVPPFGMPKISFESHHNSSEATRGLRLFCVWGNTSLTGTRSLTTLAHRSLHLLHTSSEQYSSG